MAANRGQLSRAVESDWLRDQVPASGTAGSAKTGTPNSRAYWRAARSWFSFVTMTPAIFWSAVTSASDSGFNGIGSTRKRPIGVAKAEEHKSAFTAGA